MVADEMMHGYYTLSWKGIGLHKSGSQEGVAFFGSEVDFKSDQIKYSPIVPLPSSFLSLILSHFFFFLSFSFFLSFFFSLPPRANLANRSGPTYEFGEKAASHWPILIEPDQPRNSIR